MRAAAQSFQLSSCGGEIRWLFEPLVGADEDLVRADYESSMPTSRDPTSLSLGERQCAIDRRTPFGAKRPLDCYLIYLRRFHAGPDARCSEQSSSRRTGRGEDQFLNHKFRAGAP